MEQNTTVKQAKTTAYYSNFSSTVVYKNVITAVLTAENTTVLQ